LDAIEPIRNKEGVPAWVYWLDRAKLFSNSGDREQVVACFEQAVRHSTSNATVLLGLALATLRHRHDVARGKELLESALRLPIAVTISYLPPTVEGLIRLYEGDPGAASALFFRALDYLKPIWCHPLFELQDAFIRCHLATALVRFGERERGEREFRRAEPLLRAHKCDRMIAEFQDAINSA